MVDAVDIFDKMKMVFIRRRECKLCRGEVGTGYRGLVWLKRRYGGPEELWEHFNLEHCWTNGDGDHVHSWDDFVSRVPWWLGVWGNCVTPLTVKEGGVRDLPTCGICVSLREDS